jgi:hypothetical protein
MSISSSGEGEGKGTARGEIGDGVDLFRNNPTGKGFRVCILEIGEAGTRYTSVQEHLGSLTVHSVHKVLVANQRKVSES